MLTMSNKFNVSDVLALFFFILIKCIIFFTNYMQIVLSSILMMVYFPLSFFNNKISDNLKNIFKFVGYITFTSVCFSILCDLLMLVCYLIMYFGVVNTFIVVYLVSMVQLSGLINIFYQKAKQYILK